MTNATTLTVRFNDGILFLSKDENKPASTSTSQAVANFCEELLSEHKVGFIAITPLTGRALFHPMKDGPKNLLFSESLRIVLICTLILPLFALIYKAIYRGITFGKLTLEIAKRAEPLADDLAEIEKSDPSWVKYKDKTLNSSNTSEMSSTVEGESKYTKESVGALTVYEFYEKEESERDAIARVFFSSTYPEKEVDLTETKNPLNWSLEFIGGISLNKNAQDMTPLEALLLRRMLPMKVLHLLSMDQICSIRPASLPRIKDSQIQENEGKVDLAKIKFFLQNEHWVLTHHAALVNRFSPVVRSSGIILSGDTLHLPSSTIVPLIHSSFFTHLFSKDFSTNDLPSHIQGSAHAVHEGIMDRLFSDAYLQKDREGYIRELERVRDATLNSDAFQASLFQEMKDLLQD